MDIPDYPITHVPQERLYALTEHANRLTEHWAGDVQDHLTGLLGEFSLAKPLGIEDAVDTKIYADGGDGGVDLRYRGATIDVKTVGRHRDDPALTVDAYQPLTADYYVLASRVSKTDVRIIGYAPRQFVANAPVRWHDGQPYHMVEQYYLFPIPRSIF
jgi:hypothetical protein